MKQCGAEKKKGGSKVNGLFRAIATATIGLAKNKKRQSFFKIALFVVVSGWTSLLLLQILKDLEQILNA